MKSILLLLFFSVLSFAQTKVEDVNTFTLKNGMKIMVLEDHSIPNANMYLFWKVGSRNEHMGITGLSHFFEHMMFNGSKNYGPKMFDRTMEAAGGANNAYTTENVTVYTDWFPSSSIETIYKLESDRIANLNFDEKMINSERGVVLSERSTGLENSNFDKLWQQVLGVAMVGSPYHWPVIGYKDDIEHWKKSDLQNYFATYYAPNNAVVVIAGDVNLENVKQLSEEYFGIIPAHEPPRPIHTIEPVQQGEKKLFVQKDVSTPNVMLVYHVPETKSEDFYALDLLNSILSHGRTSRLYHSLVEEKRIATDVESDLSLSFDPFLYTIYAVCSDNIKSDSLENAIYNELDQVAQNGVTEKELEKAKNEMLMQFYHRMETINGKANNLGTYELFFGDYKKLFNAPEEYKKVTADDIKTVAAKYFQKSNRTVGVLASKEGE